MPADHQPFWYVEGTEGGYMPRTLPSARHYARWASSDKGCLGYTRRSQVFVSVDRPLWTLGATFESTKITGVTALVVTVTNTTADGAPRPELILPAHLMHEVSCESVAWWLEGGDLERPRFAMVFPLAEPITVLEHAALAARVRAVLPDGGAVLPPHEPVPLPMKSARSIEYNEWRIEWFAGPLLDGRASMLRGEPVPDPDAWTPHLSLAFLDSLMRSDIYRWALARKGALSDEVLLAISSNIAAIANDFGDRIPPGIGPEAITAVTSACARALRALIPDASPDTDLGRLYVRPFLMIRRRPATYLELIEAGVPRDLVPTAIVTRDDEGAPTESLDVARESMFESARSSVRHFNPHHPGDWLFVAPNGKYHRRTPDGGVFDEGYADQSLARMLPELDARNALRMFKRQIRAAARRVPVVSTSDRLIRQGSDWVLNTYVAPTLQPLADGQKLDRVRDLIRNLAGNDVEAVEFILDWLALPVQELRLRGAYKKLRTALVFYGSQGAGKGTLTTLLELIYGETNVATLDQDRLESRFSDLLEHKLLVIANEVLSATNDERKLASKIKGLVTDPKVLIEKKGLPVYSDENRFNMIFCSNDERPVRVESTDRRFSLFYSQAAADKTLVGDIYADVTGHAAALLAELLGRVVAIDSSSTYQNSARSEVARASMAVCERFAEDLGELGYTELRNSLDPEGIERIHEPGVHNGEKYVVWAGLMKMLAVWCREHQLQLPRDVDNQLASALKRKFRLDLSAHKRRIPSDKQTITVWTGIP